MEHYSTFVQCIRASLIEQHDHGESVDKKIHKLIFRSLAGDHKDHINSREFIDSLTLLPSVVEQMDALGEEITKLYFQILLEQIDIFWSGNITKKDLYHFLFPTIGTHELGVVSAVTRQVFHFICSTLPSQVLYWPKCVLGSDGGVGELDICDIA